MSELINKARFATLEYLDSNEQLTPNDISLYNLHNITFAEKEVGAADDFAADFEDVVLRN